MKKIFIFLVVVLLVGCGGSGGDTDEGSSKGSGSVNTGSSLAGSSPFEYKKGDYIIIIKKATQENIDSFKSSMIKIVKQSKSILQSKVLESENCLSLGFTYKDVHSDEYIETKDFVKGEDECIEQTFIDDDLIGNVGIIFLIRNGQQ